MQTFDTLLVQNIKKLVEHEIERLTESIISSPFDKNGMNMVNTGRIYALRDLPKLIQEAQKLTDQTNR